MELVGIVRCPLSSFVPYGYGRQVRPKNLEQLQRRFKKFDPTKERNHIRAIITHGDLGEILKTLNTSKDALQATLHEETYPLLPDHRVAYIDGRHRLAAAAKEHRTAWWAVKLFCVQGTWSKFPLKIEFSTEPANIGQTIQDELEHGSTELGSSDGESWRLVQKYRELKDENREEECRLRLSPSKEISLKGLLKRPKIMEALNKLLQFPGLIEGLQLGNIHKHLARHCDEHILRYLQHILEVWTYIAGGNPEVMESVDPETVEYLQLRTPTTSDSDRRDINRMFADGTLFQNITNPDLREEIRLRILSLNIVIPSLMAFHENMKYLSIGIRILEKYVRLEPENKKDPPTLLQSLAGDWQEQTSFYVEVEDGILRPVSNVHPTAYLAYKNLLLAAIRYFPLLCGDHPRQDVWGETMPTFVERSRVLYLLRLAQFVGFDNEKIRDGLEQTPGQESVLDFEPEAGPMADWRGGIPFTKTFHNLKSDAFLHKLASPPPRGKVPDPSFIFNDFLKAFFDDGISDLAVDWEEGAVDLQHIEVAAPANYAQRDITNERDAQDPGGGGGDAPDVDMGQIDAEDSDTGEAEGEDIDMHQGDNSTPTGVAQTPQRPKQPKKLRLRAQRRKKERKKPRKVLQNAPLLRETIHRQSVRSPVRTPSPPPLDPGEQDIGEQASRGPGVSEESGRETEAAPGAVTVPQPPIIPSLADMARSLRPLSEYETMPDRNHARSVVWNPTSLNFGEGTAPTIGEVTMSPGQQGAATNAAKVAVPPIRGMRTARRQGSMRQSVQPDADGGGSVSDSPGSKDDYEVHLNGKRHALRPPPAKRVRFNDWGGASSEQDAERANAEDDRLETNNTEGSSSGLAQQKNPNEASINADTSSSTAVKGRYINGERGQVRAPLAKRQRRNSGHAEREDPEDEPDPQDQSRDAAIGIVEDQDARVDSPPRSPMHAPPVL